MAARLYPGFGSGRGTYEGHFTVRPIGADEGGALEAGDKLILPAAALKEITRLKLPLPLVFRVHNDKAAGAAAVPDRTGARKPALPVQLAGVVEFSAPDGVALLPRWMLAGLKLREGAQARLTSVPARELPPGTFARFWHDAPGLPGALEGAGGTRAALEAALRGYSALTLGERITVRVGGAAFSLTVVDLRPGPQVSLYGSVDLEVELTADPTHAGVVAPTTTATASPAPASSPTASRRAMPREQVTASRLTGALAQPPTPPVNGCSPAQQPALDPADAPTPAASATSAATTSRTAAQVGVWAPPSDGGGAHEAPVSGIADTLAAVALAGSPPSAAPFAGVGRPLGSGSSSSDEGLGAQLHDLGPTRLCPECGASVPPANFDLHAARCRRARTGPAAGARAAPVGAQ